MKVETDSYLYLIKKGRLKGLNYAVDNSPEYQRLLAEVEVLICSR